ncbi:NUMOD4 motif-containing HNH endonuclease [Mycobacterium sp. 48b]|uniref:NUMOD4 motif-containing HNH endonuclease n=1 Tax=Mycobacterium sp. 48b TaxID=3400426 RepID=UPI003AACB9AF
MAVTEQWRPIPGFEGAYEVSDQGQVRSLDRVTGRQRPTKRQGKLLKQAPTSSGRYLTVSLYDGTRRTNARVHRLILTAFVGPCPVGMECLHANDIGTDNRLENLRWGTRSTNTTDKVQNGRHPVANRTHCDFGHEFTPENTVYRKTGWGTYRRCLTCKRREDRDAKRKKRAA